MDQLKQLRLNSQDSNSSCSEFEEFKKEMNGVKTRKEIRSFDLRENGEIEKRNKAQQNHVEGNKTVGGTVSTFFSFFFLLGFGFCSSKSLGHFKNYPNLYIPLLKNIILHY